MGVFGTFLSWINPANWYRKLKASKDEAEHLESAHLTDFVFFGLLVQLILGGLTIFVYFKTKDSVCCMQSGNCYPTTPLGLTGCASECQFGAAGCYGMSDNNSKSILAYLLVNILGSAWMLLVGWFLGRNKVEVEFHVILAVGSIIAFTGIISLSWFLCVTTGLIYRDENDKPGSGNQPIKDATWFIMGGTALGGLLLLFPLLSVILNTHVRCDRWRVSRKVKSIYTTKKDEEQAVASGSDEER